MIFVVTGQSASGKTTLALEIAKKLKFERLISHTTRPMRTGEKEGVEYYFTTDELIEDMSLVCKNVFNNWTYGLNIDNIDHSKNYVAILEAAGAVELRNQLSLITKIIYIEAPLKLRKQRAYAREQKEYDAEIERRMKADAIDFRDFNKVSDINVLNVDKQFALNKIEKYIKAKTVSKYGAKKVVIDGITFDSQLEAKYYEHLLALKESNVVESFELQPVYELIPKFIINGKKRLATKYKADFFVKYTNGHTAVIDVKGFETTDFKLKKKMFELKYNQEVVCVTFSKIDGGWIGLEQLKKNRSLRKKVKKNLK